MHIWLRNEERLSEQRTPLTPDGAASLLKAGNQVTVETSSHRIFSDNSYQNVGCEVVRHGTWLHAPKDAYILGLKELPEVPGALIHQHIYFGHAYKGQSQSKDLLTRFHSGGGTLLDLEYIRDEHKNRAVAFGHWAGHVGMTLALIQWFGRNGAGLGEVIENLLPFTNESALDSFVDASTSNDKPHVVIIGADGRSGTGAKHVCERHGIEATLWGKNETKKLDRETLLAHDILINCTLITHPVEPFLRKEDMSLPRNLSVIADVSCDQGSYLNPIPIISQQTDWNSPVYRMQPQTLSQKPLDIIAIDNLAAILPLESSEAFARNLLPYLVDLPNLENIYWKEARRTFEYHKKNGANINQFEFENLAPCP